GIGFLALLVVMLASYRIFWVPLIALFFSAVLNGSTTLHLRTQLHSSLGGILTGVLVLFVLLFGDSQKLRLRRRSETAPAEDLSEATTHVETAGTNIPGAD